MYHKLCMCYNCSPIILSSEPCKHWKHWKFDILPKTIHTIFTFVFKCSTCVELRLVERFESQALIAVGISGA